MIMGDPASQQPMPANASTELISSIRTTRQARAAGLPVAPGLGKDHPAQMPASQQSQRRQNQRSQNEDGQASQQATNTKKPTENKKKALKNKQEAHEEEVNPTKEKRPRRNK